MRIMYTRLIAGLIFFLFILISFYSYITYTQINSGAKIPSQVSKNTSTRVLPTRMPRFQMADKENIDRAKKNYEKRLKEQGKPVPTATPYIEYKFVIGETLKNKLTEKPRSFFSRFSAHADDICDPSQFPGILNIYTLKSSPEEIDPSGISSLFGLHSQTYSLPSDGLSPQYFYTDNESKAFLSVLMGSGSFTYHQAVENVNPDKKGEFQKINEELLTKYILSDPFKKRTDYAVISEPDSGDADHQTIYKKNWNNLKILDKPALAGSGSTPVCKLKESTVTNQVEIILKSDGQLTKLISRQRTPNKSVSAARETLENSIKEFGDSLLIDPVIIPENKTLNQPIQEVTIDDVTLVYYDYGLENPQNFYIPFYLTSGTTTASDGSQVRVFTLFPGVARKTLILNKIIKDTAAASNLVEDTAQKQQSFAMTTPTPTPLPAPPASALTSGTGLCWGNIVDYTISCSAEGTMFCNAFMPIKPEDDPADTCSVGCNSKTELMDVTAGEDPCMKMLQKRGVTFDPTTYKNSNPYSKESPVNKSYSCIVSGCPC